MDIRAPSPARTVDCERTAAPGSDPRLNVLLGNALFLDLETNKQGAIHKIGALRNGRDFFRQFFRLLGARRLGVGEVHRTLLAQWHGKACCHSAPRLILDYLAEPQRRPVLAYAAAWLTVAGANSVLPPWVRNRFPATVPLLKALRDLPCGRPDCSWCGSQSGPAA